LGNNPDDSEIIVSFCTAPEIQFSVLNAWASSIGNAPPVGQWINVALRCKAQESPTPSTRCDLIVNGTLVATRTLGGIIPMLSRSKQYIGKSLWNDPSIDLSVRTFRVWSTALSDAALSALAFHPILSSVPSLTVAYNFDEDCALRPVTPTASPTPSPTLDRRGGDREVLLALNAGLAAVINTDTWTDIAARYDIRIPAPAPSSLAVFPLPPIFKGTLYDVVYVTRHLRVCRSTALNPPLFYYNGTQSVGFEADLLKGVLGILASYYLNEETSIDIIYVPINVPPGTDALTVLGAEMWAGKCEAIQDGIITASSNTSSPYRYGFSDSYLDQSFVAVAYKFINPGVFSSYATLVESLLQYPFFTIGVLSGDSFGDLLSSSFVPAAQVIAYNTTTDGLNALGKNIDAFGGSDISLSGWQQENSDDIALYPFSDLSETSYRFVTRIV